MATLPDILAGQRASAQQRGEAVSEKLPHVTFEYGGSRYAVDVRMVREVVEAPPVKPYPHTHPEHLGIVNIRGRILPVLNPNLRGSQQQTQSCDRLLILEFADNLPFGLLVQKVSKVLLEPQSSQPGITVDVGGHPVLVLDQSLFQQSREGQV